MVVSNFAHTIGEMFFQCHLREENRRGRLRAILSLGYCHDIYQTVRLQEEYHKDWIQETLREQHAATGKNRQEEDNNTCRSQHNRHNKDWTFQYKPPLFCAVSLSKPLIGSPILTSALKGKTIDASNVPHNMGMQSAFLVKQGNVQRDGSH